MELVLHRAKIPRRWWHERRARMLPQENHLGQPSGTQLGKIHFPHMKQLHRVRRNDEP